MSKMQQRIFHWVLSRFSLDSRRLKWNATTLFVVAGILISLNIPESKYAFPIFAIGHAVILYVFFKLRDTPMIIQNSFFLCIDFLGIYKWLI